MLLANASNNPQIEHPLFINPLTGLFLLIIFYICLVLVKNKSAYYYELSLK